MNQGTGLKYSPASPFLNLYHEKNAPSGKEGKAVMSLFSCFSRDVVAEIEVGGRRGEEGDKVERNEKGEKMNRKGEGGQEEDEKKRSKPQKRKRKSLTISLLERHPYTTQTFAPLGLAPAISPQQNVHNGTDDDDASARFLVVVGPSLPNSLPATTATTANISKDSTRRQNTTTTNIPSSMNPQVSISNPPDLFSLRAFLAHGAQAITYSPGTWHAPMIVLGNGNKGTSRNEDRAGDEKEEKKVKGDTNGGANGNVRVDFIVTQFVNGVQEEDCEEIQWIGPGVKVVLDD